MFASCGPEGGVTRFTYDDAGNLPTVQAPVNNTTTYSYDGVGRVTMETNELDDARSYYYDSLGRVVKVLDRNERVVQFEFDAMDRLTMLEYEHGGTDLFTPYEWSYDNIHRITQFVSEDGTSDYEYDKTSQLTDADHDYQTDESYSYDANGNRTMTGYQTGGNNQLQNDGTHSYEYDGEGNRTSRTNDTTDEVTEYEWDHRNRLTKVTEKDEYGGTTQVVEYTYDVFNRRIGKAVDTTSPFTMTDAVIERYIYDDVTGVASLDGGNVVLDFIDPDGDGSTPIALERRYLYGHAVDQILAHEDVTESTSSADRVLWPLVDHLGTVRDLAQNDGTLGEHYEYDSYGNIASGDTSVTRYLFTSREFDEDTGLQYNRARWYDPAVGRWVSDDPIGFLGGDENLARYVGNRALSASDPSGLVERPDWMIWAELVVGTLYPFTSTIPSTVDAVVNTPHGVMNAIQSDFDAFSSFVNDGEITPPFAYSTVQMSYQLTIPGYVLFRPMIDGLVTSGQAAHNTTVAAGYSYGMVAYVTVAKPASDVLVTGALTNAVTGQNLTIAYQDGIPVLVEQELSLAGQLQAAQTANIQFGTAVVGGLEFSGWMTGSGGVQAGYTGTGFGRPSVGVGVSASNTGGPRYRSIYDEGTLVVDGQQPPRLPRTADSAATGPHSRVRYDDVNGRVYQFREFDADGNLVRDIDLTNPTFPNGTPRPGHPGPPHQHIYKVNDPSIGPRSGFRRGGPEPLGGGA